MSRRVVFALALLVIFTIPGLIAGSLNAAFFPASALRAGLFAYIASQVVVWWVWPVLTPAVVALVRRFPLERDALRRSLPVHLAAALACTLLYVLGYAIVARILTPATERREAILMLVRGYVASRGPVGLFLYAAIAGATIAVDERVRRRERELHAAQLQLELSRAQLSALQMQLQPHFLFNTLHTISMLAAENPRAAAHTITLLGDLLRRTLALADVPEVSLREEVEILRGYLEIEEIRFGDRLTVTIAVDDNVLGVPVPAFLLQPLVENAVRHGVAPRMEPGRVTVRAQRVSGSVRIEIVDDGPGFGAAHTRDGGVGLGGTERRLTALYGHHATLVCENAPDGGARVIVTVPVRDV